MKKLVGILLLFSLMAPVTGTFLWLQFQKKMLKKSIKRKMMAGIEKEELVLLKFTKTEAERELRWEHSKEFEYRGEMYDVVERTSKGDSICYWCW